MYTPLVDQNIDVGNKTGLHHPPDDRLGKYRGVFYRINHGNINDAHPECPDVFLGTDMFSVKAVKDVDIETRAEKKARRMTEMLKPKKANTLEF